MIIEMPTSQILDIIYENIDNLNSEKKEILELYDSSMLSSARSILDDRLVELSNIEAEYSKLIKRLY